MIYFIAKDVCNKLKIRNSSQVFSRHGLIEGRDYLRFSQKMNPGLFQVLLDTNLIDKHSTVSFVLTTSGVMELLFKSKSINSDIHESDSMLISARKIKDELLSNPDYSIYSTQSYLLIKRIIAGMTPKKLDKFYASEEFAIKYITDISGKLTAEIVSAIEVIRTFANSGPDKHEGIADFNTNVLIKNFSHFSYHSTTISF